ncbi:MAG TPA: pitrilysin family protein [Candidatus Limnocylindria bacterium]|nr:pitrilysin family protein [Candidatus Limnocylindria bacterium]
MTRVANPRRPSPGAPRPYHFPAFERHALSNGLTVWLVPLPGRGLVNVHLLADAGASAEPEERAGVAALTAQVLVTGTKRLDAAAFAAATERLGIEVSSESSWDSARAAFQALPEHVDEGLSLLAEMVREPRLDADEFERLKAERLADILQARADAGRLAEEMFLRHLYAPDSPYGRLSAGTPESVGELAVEHVRDFHATHWGPSTAHLIVAGGFDPQTVLRSAEAHLGSWSGGGPGHRSIEARPAGGRRVVIVDRPGSVQSELRVGQIGIERDHPDYFPAIVMAAVLGGVFGSRLNLRLREELGYTYGAHASFDPRRSAGPMISRAAVQTEVTAPAIRELLAQLDRLRSEAPSPEELAEVRNFMIGVFPLRFEATGGVAAAIEPLAVYGLPDDYWQTYRSRIEVVGPEDVRRVAEALIRPDQLLILLSGDASAVRDAVEAEGFGPLEVVAAPS